MYCTSALHCCASVLLLDWNGGSSCLTPLFPVPGAIHNDPELPSHIPWWSHLMVAHSCSRAEVIMCIFGSEVTFFYLQHFPNWTFVLCHSFQPVVKYIDTSKYILSVFKAQICSEKESEYWISQNKLWYLSVQAQLSCLHSWALKMKSIL